MHGKGNELNRKQTKKAVQIHENSNANMWLHRKTIILLAVFLQLQIEYISCRCVRNVNVQRSRIYSSKMHKKIKNGGIFYMLMMHAFTEAIYLYFIAVQ